MHEDINWSHNEAFHLGRLTKELNLDCVITKDNCFMVNGYPITNEDQLATFVSALKIVADPSVFETQEV